MKNRSFQERLMFAVNGVGVAWQRESSFRTQIIVTVLAIVVLVVLRPAVVWWAIVGLTIAFVLAAELMNSAFEGLVDHLHPERHPEIRVIKDMAAGGVLLASVGALLVGFLFLISML
jgi:undecaprenol kinase